MGFADTVPSALAHPFLTTAQQTLTVGTAFYVKRCPHTRAQVSVHLRAHAPGANFHQRLTR